MTVYLANQRTRKTMNKNEIIEIAGKSFELVPNTSDPLGYLLKPVKEKKPVKAEVIWLAEDKEKPSSKTGKCVVHYGVFCPFTNTKDFDLIKAVRPMKRGDVLNAIDGLAGHYSSIDEDEAINNILDRLEELGLIQKGES